MAAPTLLAAVGNGELKVYEQLGDKVAPTASWKGGPVLSCVAWNHTNQVLAVGGSKPTISLIQANNGQLLSTIPFTAEQVFQGSVSALAFSSNSRYLASACGKFVHLWDLKRRNMKAYFGEAGGTVSCVAVSTDGASGGDIVAGDASGAVRIWDMKQQYRVLPSSSAGAAMCLQLSCLGPYRVAAGFSDGALNVWDYQTSALLRSQVVHNNGHALTGLAHSPKNAKLIATVGSDGRVTLIDTASNPATPPSATIDVGDKLTSISFQDDAIHCAVGTNSGYVLLFDWRNVRKPVAKIDAHMPYPVSAVAFQVPKPLPVSASASASASPLPPSSASSLDSTASATPSKAKAAPSAAPSLSSATKKSLQDEQQQQLPPPLPGPQRIASSPGRPGARDKTGPPPPPASSISSLSVGSFIDTAPPAKGVPASAAAATTVGSAAASPGRHKNKLRDSGESLPGLAGGTGANAGLLRSLSPIQSGGGSVVSDEPSLAKLASAVSSGAKPKPQTQPLSLSQPVAISAAVSANMFAPPAVKTTTPAPTTGQSKSVLNTSAAPVPPAPTPAPTVSASTAPEFDALRKAIQPVSNQEFQEALHLLRYDVHKEIQAITREQVRQFAMAKVRVSTLLSCSAHFCPHIRLLHLHVSNHTTPQEDTAELIGRLSQQLSDLLQANAELRAENERLRRVY